MKLEFAVFTKKVSGLNIVVFVVRKLGYDKLLQSSGIPVEYDYVKTIPFCRNGRLYVSFRWNFGPASMSILTCPLDHKFKSGTTLLDYLILGDMFFISVGGEKKRGNNALRS